MDSARRYHNIDGYVWCDKLTEIHDIVYSEFDPYSHGDPEDFCHPEDHRPVAMLATAEGDGMTSKSQRWSVTFYAFAFSMFVLYGRLEDVWAGAIMSGAFLILEIIDYAALKFKETS